MKFNVVSLLVAALPSLRYATLSFAAAILPRDEIQGHITAAGEVQNGNCPGYPPVSSTPTTTWSYAPPTTHHTSTSAWTTKTTPVYTPPPLSHSPQQPPPSKPLPSTTAETTTTVTVTNPAATATGGASTCSTGPVQCCNSVQSSKSQSAASLLSLLGIVLQGADVPIGLNCSPISVIGGGSGGSCSAQTVCCQNDQFNGLINIGCTPINLDL